MKERCGHFNILLFIVDGGLTPKANMADVQYIKTTKKLVNEKLMKWRMSKYKEAKARLTDGDGVLRGEPKVPQMDLVTFMNIIIKCWYGNDFSRVKERWPELRMVSKALADEIGWTPDKAFNDYNPTPAEREIVSNILPPSVQPINSLSWENKRIIRVQKKCARKATHGYCTRVLIGCPDSVSSTVWKVCLCWVYGNHRLRWEKERKWHVKCLIVRKHQARSDALFKNQITLMDRTR